MAHFSPVEWRLLNPHGEAVGEADVVFHPHLGVVVLEVKAGAVRVRAATGSTPPACP